DLSQQQASTYDLLRSALASAGFSDLALTADGYRSFLNSLSQTGFSSEELSFFSQLGLTTADIALIRDILLTVDPSRHAPPFFALLDSLSEVTAELAADLGAPPEPAALLLWGTTMAAVGIAGRWRRHSQN